MTRNQSLAQQRSLAIGNEWRLNPTARQFCVVTTTLQAALPTSLGGCASRAVIISSEGRFPIARLQSMSKAVWSGLSAAQLKTCEGEGITRELLWSVHVIKEARTADDLVLACEQASRWLGARASDRSGKPGAGIVLVDSIAAPFRTRDDDPAAPVGATSGPDDNGTPKRARAASRTSWYGARSKALFGISSELRAMAARFDVPVVVTNQVTALVSNDDHRCDDSPVGASPAFTPALGLAWAHGMHTRILLLRGDRRAGCAAAARRRIRLVFHPAAACGEALCVLGDAGFADVA